MSPQQIHLAKTQVRLTKEEQRGKRARVAFYYLLYGLLLVGALLTLGSLYAWLQTIEITRSFINTGSLEIQGQESLSLLDRFLRLDISTTSAFIILLFSFFMTYGCCKIFLRHHKNGKEKFSYVYHLNLFPQSLGGLCIRLGLIGTLVSFVLIALMLFKSTTGTSPKESSLDQGVTLNVDTVDESNLLTDDNGKEKSEVGSLESFARAGQSSYQVFLFLCASLYSTLVGCLFGYFIIPFVEMVGAIAMGQHQVITQNPFEVNEQYVRQVKSVIAQMQKMEKHFEQFGDVASAVDTTVKNFEKLNDYIQTISSSTKELVSAGNVLKETTGSLNQANHVLQASTDQIAKASKVAIKLQSHSNSWIRALQKTGRTARTTIRDVRKTGEKVATRIEEAAQKVSQEIREDFEKYHSSVQSEQKEMLNNCHTVKEAHVQISQVISILNEVSKDLCALRQEDLKSRQALKQDLNVMQGQLTQISSLHRNHSGAKQRRVNLLEWVPPFNKRRG